MNEKLRSHLSLRCEFTVNICEFTTKAVNLGVKTHTNGCDMTAHHTDVCGAWGVGVNGVRWPESVWTKTAVSRNGGVLQTSQKAVLKPLGVLRIST